MVGGKPCPSTTHSDTNAECVVPPGVGFGLDVRARAGRTGRAGVLRAQFSYDAPSLLGIEPSGADTEGGALLTLVGASFGTRELGHAHATVGERPVAWFLEHSHTRCVFAAPAGGGAALDVRFSVGGQTGVLSRVFSYSAPSINAMQPRRGGISGGFELTLRGASLGNLTNAAAMGHLRLIWAGTVLAPLDFAARLVQHSHDAIVMRVSDWRRRVATIRDIALDRVARREDLRLSVPL